MPGSGIKYIGCILVVLGWIGPFALMKTHGPSPCSLTECAKQKSNVCFTENKRRGHLINDCEDLWSSANCIRLNSKKLPPSLRKGAHPPEGWAKYPIGRWSLLKLLATPDPSKSGIRLCRPAADPIHQYVYTGGLERDDGGPVYKQ